MDGNTGMGWTMEDYGKTQYRTYGTKTSEAEDGAEEGIGRKETERNRDLAGGAIRTPCHNGHETPCGWSGSIGTLGMPSPQAQSTSADPPLSLIHI